MAIHLRDIIDLDFLLSLDERERSGSLDEILARDRDIFNHLDNPDLDDKGLIFSWLSYRRLVFFHETKGLSSHPAPDRIQVPAGYQNLPRDSLPGTLFSNLFKWMAGGLGVTGFVLGVLMVYSFLAYHGSRPVNVTVFASFFIIFQALLSVLACGVMLNRMVRKQRRTIGFGISFFPALVSGFFFKKLSGLLKKTKNMPGGGAVAAMADAGSLVVMKNREYNGILFWPFFILSSFFALSFSTGALCGTLFRVLVTDLAFGWQSTLLTSGTQVHDLVSWMALPWSWLSSGTFALPSLEQVEGSRILLKEGILGLATEHLISWWPFLCMGILVYGVLVRGLLVIGAGLAQKKALAQFDFQQPRYRRLMAGMTSPTMDMEIQENFASQVKDRAPLPNPDIPGSPNLDPADLEKSASIHQPQGHALVLASSLVYQGTDLETINQMVEQQLGVVVSEVCPISFDFDSDNNSNKHECWGEYKTATFMVLGEICTRGCRFCSVGTGKPEKVDTTEPSKVASAVKNLNLKHVVITMVTRDDLEDGGATILSETVLEVRKINKDCTIEVLSSDLRGKEENILILCKSSPEVISHNIETVKRLKKEICSGASYEQSIDVLKMMKRNCPDSIVKSSIMIGLGEEKEEILQTMDDLLKAGVSILNIGQYLQPSKKNHPVKKYWTPEEFEELKEIALKKGFSFCESGPLVRSSYHAGKHFAEYKELK